MGRFTDRAFAVDGLNSELYSYFNALKAARVAMDERIEAWAARLTDQLLKGRLEFTSIVNPHKGMYEMMVCVTHFYNHHTHHRGQLTALLSQAGADYGVTDLIWLLQIVAASF